MRTQLRPVAAVAARQHGIVSRRQLVDLGYRRDAITRLLRTGHLHRLHRGVYAVGHTRIVREGHWLAAVLACGDGAFLSHGPAGQLLGIIDGRERFALHVSLTGRVDRRPAGIVTHRPRSLSAADTTIRHAIPTTSATRTVFDLASRLSPLQTRRAFEQAEKRGLDRIRLAALLAAQPNRKGAGVIRLLLADRVLPLAETRSRLEELLLEICRDHGLPLPAANVPLLGYEVDFLWPAARFVVEVDGGGHLDRPQRDRDNARDLELGRAGHLVRRYTYSALADRDAVAAEIVAILVERLPGDSRRRSRT